MTQSPFRGARGGSCPAMPTRRARVNRALLPSPYNAPMPAPGRLLAAWVVAGAALLAGGPAADGQDDGLPTFLAPIRADVLVRQGLAHFKTSAAPGEDPAAAFDGKAGTVFRVPGPGPATLEVTFREPREVLSAEVLLSGADHLEWSLLAGPDDARLRTVVPPNRCVGGRWSSVERLGSGVSARTWRLVARRTGGGGAEIAEVALQARQRPVAVEVQAPSAIVCPAGDLTLRARVHFDGGYRSGSVLGLGFFAPADAPFRLEPGPSSEGKTVVVRYEGKGSAPVIARIKAKGGWLESPPLVIEAVPEGVVDWSVGWIERTPRLDFDGPNGGLPEKGEAVVYVAHVRNYGTRASGRVPYQWQLDGRTVDEGFVEGLDRFEERTASIRLPWDGVRRSLRFVVNPSGSIPETSRSNDEVTIQTDALRLGLWVERPVLDHFHRMQSSFGDGANGFEDWAQRMIRRWNRMLADARGPLAPEGVTERFALDLVVEADEGALPLREGLPANDPDAADRSVDIQWGFPASLLDGEGWSVPAERRDDNPLWFDGTLLRELGRARYLADLGRLDVRADEVLLDTPEGSPLAGSPWLPLRGQGRVRVSPSGGVTAGDPSRGFTAHEASAFQRVAGRRARGANHGRPPESGEYLGDLPRTCAIRVVGADGKPLDGVTVRAWRRAPDESGREVFSGEPFLDALTSDGGYAGLEHSGEDPFFDGRREGALDPGRGILLLELQHGGRSCWRFLEVVPYNLAFWSGSKDAHVEDVPVDLRR